MKEVEPDHGPWALYIAKELAGCAKRANGHVQGHAITRHVCFSSRHVHGAAGCLAQWVAPGLAEHPELGLPFAAFRWLLCSLIA